MKEGVVQQFDTPDKVYHFPANLFVADFIGNPKVNLLDGVVSGKNSVDLGKFKITINTGNANGSVVVGIRPEDIAIFSQPHPGSGGVQRLFRSALRSRLDHYRPPG